MGTDRDKVMTFHNPHVFAQREGDGLNPQSGRRLMTWLLAHVHMVAAAAAFFGVASAAFGGFVAYLVQVNQVRAAQNRVQFERDMREKAEANLARTNEAISFITGGDSYCFVTMNTPQADGRISPVLFQHGNYPCYDVEVTIGDATARGSWMAKEIAAGRFPTPSFGRDQFDHHIRVGTVGVGGMVIFDEIRIPELASSQDFQVTVTSRNCGVEISEQYRKIDGKWLRHVRRNLLRTGKSTVLLEEADPGWPKGS